jgi:hypothetical protein
VLLLLLLLICHSQTVQHALQEATWLAMDTSNAICSFM